MREGKFPPWLKRRLPAGENMLEVMRLLRSQELHTVCEEARCPNLGECFSNRTATFLILGDTCTRGCGFCSVTSGNPAPVDENEPTRIKNAVENLGLKYVVITSVSRDDLVDGGAGHFANVIRAVRQIRPQPLVEVLTPDFNGDIDAIRTVALEMPDVYNHNLETVRELYPKVRPRADYRRSLDLLRTIKDEFNGVVTKTGVMVGLGESVEQLRELFYDVAQVNCDMITIGQYLKPAQGKIEIAEYYTPDEFNNLRNMALKSGIKYVFSGPFVRSSFMAGEAYLALQHRP
ncbi:MAG: lipoyl synthase [Actinobacteria bacterium]|nr:lipoyl synthase [Actinomycetota bacterium]